MDFEFKDNSIVSIRVDDCVSHELETIQLVRALIDDVSLSKNINIVKSEYPFSHLDFLMYNRQNLRTLGIECKSFVDEPSELSCLKIKTILRDYDFKVIYVIKYASQLLWVNLRAIDFDKVEVVDRFKKTNRGLEEEKRYVLSSYMNNDLDELSTFITLSMIGKD